MRAATPVDNAPFAGAAAVRDVSIPAVFGGFGIPEMALAAYRNAELALASSEPGCGLSWNLLAGIGRIESGHASGGRTDAAGTTVTPILGPALDGTLPGNEVISAGLDAQGNHSYVRAMGPMQFLPSTWTHYASDGNADGVADPNNVFDAALAAGKYLCSGGMNLRDPAQELRAVLRYNNSMAYAANVLSWSAAYRTGAMPTSVDISPDLIPPGTAPIDVAALADPSIAAETKTTTPPSSTAAAEPATTQLAIPGLPVVNLPCAYFYCPPPAAQPPAVPGDQQAVQQQGQDAQQLQSQGQQQAPELNEQKKLEEQQAAPSQGPAAPPQPAAPAIEIPQFNITIPLPIPPAAAPAPAPAPAPMPAP